MKLDAGIFAAAICLIPKFSVAWWDEGHMLTAAVARELLSDAQVAAIELPLRDWFPDFNKSRSMIAAAVWPDHIKCTFDSEICGGFERQNSLTVFDSWHYMMMPFNPTNINLKKPFDNLPWPGVGAVPTLKWLTRGPWDLNHWNQELGQDELILRPGRHEMQLNTKELNNLLPLSAFSWNIRLRFIIHILGDLHQPLHSIETFTKQFPSGDRGGNRWRIDSSDGPVMNLHAYWDSCAKQFSRDWPQMTEVEIIKLAKELISENPPESFEQSRINLTSFEDISIDTFKVAVKYAYSFIDFNNTNINETSILRLSDDYEMTAKKICREQIVLGGYRLAQLLVELYNVALEEWTIVNKTNIIPSIVAIDIESPTMNDHHIFSTEHHLRPTSVFFGLIIGSLTTTACYHYLHNRQQQQQPQVHANLAEPFLHHAEVSNPDNLNEDISRVQ